MRFAWSYVVIVAAIVALVLTCAHASAEQQFNPKLEWGLETCHEIADLENYDDCTVWLSADESSMTLTFHCEVWDNDRGMWILPEGPVQHYQWTNRGAVLVAEPPLMLGCPVTT